MRTFQPDFAAHIGNRCTTLAWCWKVTRQDGAVMGFTDHDRALSVAGVVYQAASGFAGTEVESALGLAVDNMDVEGALSSDAIREEDIAAGLYDDAEVVLLRVNWQNPAQFAVMKRGNLGEVTRGEIGFQAEFRGLAHRLQQTIGRTYQFGCDAALGSARCGVDLETSANKAAGAVVSVAGSAFRVSGLDGYANEHFSRGLLTWETGANAGAVVKVKTHKSDGGAVEISPWLRPVHTVEAGDTFTIRAGCPHTFDACREKFNNALNFRGFPHLPGNDFVLGYARQDEQENDGSAIVK